MKKIFFALLGLICSSFGISMEIPGYVSASMMKLSFVPGITLPGGITPGGTVVSKVFKSTTLTDLVTQVQTFVNASLLPQLFGVVSVDFNASEPGNSEYTVVLYYSNVPGMIEAGSQYFVRGVVKGTPRELETAVNAALAPFNSVVLLYTKYSMAEPGNDELSAFIIGVQFAAP